MQTTRGSQHQRMMQTTSNNKRNNKNNYTTKTTADMKRRKQITSNTSNINTSSMNKGIDTTHATTGVWRKRWYPNFFGRSLFRPESQCHRIRNLIHAHAGTSSAAGTTSANIGGGAGASCRPVSPHLEEAILLPVFWIAIVAMRAHVAPCVALQMPRANHVVSCSLCQIYEEAAESH